MFGFIIPACVREEIHNESLFNCLISIQKFHPNNKCVVIVDYTSNKKLIEKIIDNFPLVIFELNTPEIPAEVLPLSYFKKNHYFDKAIIIQDSMFITKKFEIDNIKDIKYLWHFNNHRIRWKDSLEPTTEYNIQHNIKTHDDLINHIIYNLPESGFKHYCKEYYMKKDLWSGCFGCCCIISYDFLSKLDDKTYIIELQSKMITKRLRMAIESLFSLACEYTLGNHITDSYDGLYYDGQFIHNNLTSEHIKKVSFNR